ncbi:IS481 family transposase [Mycobacterium avium subsp. paratuberculosis]|nr:IS481 family transposase [Mycobacterium avium subsp. paratuberculosis]
MAVISDGLSVSQAAEKFGVARQTLHRWLARYEAAGLEGLVDRSHRPVSCPHQMLAVVEAAVLELRRSRPYWGPRRLVFELAKRCPSGAVGVGGVSSAGAGRSDRPRDARSTVAQMEALGARGADGVVAARHRRRVPLADGTSAKALTGIDDHSRMCVCAKLMARERTRAVCDGLRAALAAYGVPEQILTDNGKVFTERFCHPPVEVLFDAICREHGIEHLLTQPRSPTTTGKIEQFHRSLRAEFLSGREPFTNLKVAQQALDEWVEDYNTTRPHQALKMITPAQRFHAGAPASPPELVCPTRRPQW